ncbi:MAG TPA: LD-carboxypeptidase [Cryomorphaceae bacterium]|nr:LD-carboxypeptidase [Cryomorphaceae bacterium]
MVGKDNDLNMQAHTPKHLQPGDEIRLISTARTAEKNYIDLAISEIEKRGFKATLGNHLFSKSNQFAGTDVERLADLNDAIQDDNVRAILCAKGGYGTARLLDGIDAKAFHNDPKWICGYSDVTALHSHVYNVFRTQSLHSCMPVGFANYTSEALDSLFDLLAGKAISYEADTHDLNRAGNAEGIMVGGNLSVLYSLLGSTAQVSPSGKILFIEDLDEYLYHIDRMMLALDRAGILENVSAVVVGGMTDMNDNKVPFGKTAEEIIAERLAPFKFPVAFHFPSGHFDDNRAWIHGKKIRLTVRNGQPSLLQ